MWNHSTELNSKNLTLNHYTKLHLLVFLRKSAKTALKKKQLTATTA